LDLRLDRADTSSQRVFITRPAVTCLADAPAVEIAAGAVRRDTVTLLSSESPSATPAVNPMERTGTFRITYVLYSTADGGVANLLPVDQRRSNVFRLAY
jgi:hypothetical protein